MSFLKANVNFLVQYAIQKINYQQIRHNLRYRRKEPFRKPIWTTMAPSKLFRIRKRPELSEKEMKQRQHLEYTYEINMKSINEYLRKTFYEPTLKEDSENISENMDQEIAELEKAIEENNKINKKIAAMRDERMEILKTELAAKFAMQKIKDEEENRRLGEEFDRKVEREIERSKTYITMDNIDEKIEEALTHQTNYDYAIDVNGKIIFDGFLHPYAFKAKAVPETSSQTEESHNVDLSKPVYLKAKKIY